MKRLFCFILCGSLITALGLLFGKVRPTGLIAPTADSVFTTTREVTSLAVAPDGRLWVGTTGGVLCRDREGRWRKFTRQDGLPAHETRRIVIQDGMVKAVFPRGSVVWQEGRWQPAKPISQSEIENQKSKIHSGETVTCEAIWKGRECVATLTGLRLRKDKTWRTVPLPDSSGTHISTLLPRGETLRAALFGDGLWDFDGKEWLPVTIGLPPNAREITVLVEAGETLWLGTRRAGVWQYDGEKWTQHLQPDEPYNHNIQTFALFDNRLFVSTLEDGLAVRTAQGWRQETTPALSSVAPRQMAVFQGALYLRHGNGIVDRFDGRNWTRDVCGQLPRGMAMMIAADDRRLYIAQWGGWSEFDGETWTHYLKLPELQGCPITVLYPDGDTLWLGTQNRGLAEFDRRTGRLRLHDERHGLPDDWITAIARVGPKLAVGTFVGGLVQWDGTHWTPPELPGENVTALAPNGAGRLWIGTRTGLWYQDASGHLTQPGAQAQFLDTEIQALYPVPGGLWVGARTGLFFLIYHGTSSE